MNQQEMVKDMARYAARDVEGTNEVMFINLKTIAAFCGVHPQTARPWLKGLDKNGQLYYIPEVVRRIRERSKTA